jgi:hypothetical protein
VDIWVFVLMGIIVLITTVSYFVIMFFFPEWVGITGKKAIEAERSHQSGEAAGDGDKLLDSMQGNLKK